MEICSLLFFLLACVGLAVCEPDVVETWEGAKTNLKTTGTTAVLDLGNPDLSTEGYEIMTLAGTGKLTGETQLKVENTPYIIPYVMGDPLFLGRGSYLWDPANYKK